MSKREQSYLPIPVDHEEAVLNTLVWWIVFKELDATYPEWVGLIQSTPTNIWKCAHNRLLDELFGDKHHFAFIDTKTIKNVIVQTEDRLTKLN